MNTALLICDWPGTKKIFPQKNRDPRTTVASRSHPMHSLKLCYTKVVGGHSGYPGGDAQDEDIFHNKGFLVNTHECLSFQTFFTLSPIERWLFIKIMWHHQMTSALLLSRVTQSPRIFKTYSHLTAVQAQIPVTDRTCGQTTKGTGVNVKELRE